MRRIAMRRTATTVVGGIALFLLSSMLFVSGGSSGFSVGNVNLLTRVVGPRPDI
jgi:hypothetical protein